MTDNWSFIEQARDIGLVTDRNYVSGIDIMSRVRNYLDEENNDSGVWLRLEESMRPENYDYIVKHWRGAACAYTNT